MHKEKKRALWATFIAVALSIVFAWECGVISIPTWTTGVFKTNAVHADIQSTAALTVNQPVTTPAANRPTTTPVANQPATTPAAGRHETQLCGEMGCPTTPEELDVQRKLAAAASKKAATNWVQIATFAGIAGALIAAFMFWRRYKNRDKVVFVDKEGKKLPEPPKRKFEQAELILPGDARFADLSFDKVIGQAEAKVEIMEFLEFLENPEKFKKKKARMPRGVLMYGAPGTGKTLLVKALASHAGIPVLVISGSDFVEMFVGVGASRVRDLYEDADALAAIYGWCIIFIDEMEAVGGKRGGGAGNGGNREHDQTINQLLVEMDGVVPRPNVITIGASNRKDMIDPALLRPKRLDRHVEFFPPNRKDREALFALYIPEELRADDLDLKKAARTTPSASGAHIEAMANEAKIFAARWDLEKVNMKCLDEAILKVRMGPARQSDRAMLSQGELDTVKVHEGGHAYVYWKLTGKAPERFTIIPRGQTGGHVEFSEDWETMRTKEGFETHLAVAMGGWASTKVMRDGQHDTGISSDFDQANRIAIAMVAQYGMSDLGFINLPALTEAGLVSEELKGKVNKEVNNLLEAAKKKALTLVTDNKAELQKLIDAVGVRETLLSKDFEELFMTGELPPEDKDDGPTPPKHDDKNDDDDGPEITLPEPVDGAGKSFSPRELLKKLRPGKRASGLPSWLRPAGSTADNRGRPIKIKDRS
jgi:cell division protease FtsH